VPPGDVDYVLDRMPLLVELMADARQVGAPPIKFADFARRTERAWT
jgi:hypothetical protein